VGVQPTVEHSDSIVETVGGTDRYESLTAADGAGWGVIRHRPAAPVWEGVLSPTA